MEKLISIIIPCYNVENYIDRCLQSLIRQTIGIDNLEIILVDDGSSDNTWNHLSAMEQQYPQSVIAIHCDENGRQGRARNIGMEYVSAPYVGFVDSDDWIETDMYERLYEKMQDFHPDIVMCDMWRDLGKAEQILPPRRTEGREDWQLLVDTLEKRRAFLAGSIMGFCVWNKLYRVELLRENNIFFPERLAYEDHFFATLLYFYVRKVYIIEERLYHYFVNETSTIMTSNAAHHFDILEVDTLLWDECVKRGLLEEYREVLEYQFLSLCYMTSVKMLLLRNKEVPYDYFLHLKAAVLERVPNYHANRYVKELVTDLYKVILELLDKDMDESELKEFFYSLYTYVKKGQLKM